MTATATVEEKPPVAAPDASRSRMERANIDASTRFPVLMFYSSALAWLVVYSVISLITSVKLHYPDFLGEWSFLTYGRLYPVQINALVYGWASQVGIGTAVWIMARLSRVQIRYPLMVTFGAVLWNLGLTIGSIGIIAGSQSPYRYLEYPGFAAPVIFCGYAVIGIWGVILYRFRRPGHVFVSQWYLLCAFFCFPWFYAVANLMLKALPVSGAVQAAVQFWYAGDLFGLWLTALGLGTAYYLIPKVIGKPIYSYHLAAFGFWTFVIFYCWRGYPGLVGGPLPAWVITVSIVATVLTVIPVATVALNHHMTMLGRFRMMHFSPTLRFTVVGTMAYTLASAVAIVMSFRSTDRLLQFTFAEEGYMRLDLYAFYTMVMFGSMYYIVPRLVGCEWRSAWLIKLHFWGSGYGIGLMVIMLFVGGLFQGETMLDPTTTFAQGIDSVLPLLRGRTVAQVMLFFGHLVFALHFLIMILRLGRPGGAPTLLAESHAEVVK